MPVGKNPYLRYHILNTCFTSPQKLYWTSEELIRRLEEYDLNVSLRTLKVDLETMRHDERLGFNAPIAYCPKERAYHYTDKNYSINTMQLSDDQLRSFSSIVELLQQFRGSKLVKDFEGAIDKIVRGVDVLRRQKMSGTQKIQTESAPYYKGMEHFDTLVQAIDTRQCQRISYQKFNSKKQDDHVFHPYFLKEDKGRWYVVGHSEARESPLITLGLDRMEKIQPEEKPYKVNKELKASEYFKNTIGVTVSPGPVEEIILWFSPTKAPYIKTQHLHASQQTIKEDQDGLTIRLKLIINYELLSMLLSYCPDVSVVQPLSLKKKLNELLQKGIELNKE